MTPDTVIRLSQNQHKDLVQYVRNVYLFLGGNDMNLRAGLEYRDRVYYRENDWTPAQQRARWANYWGDAKRMQNPVVPIVAPQVETALGYLMEVFLTGEPIFGVVSKPSQVDAGLQLESVIADNSRRFSWRAEFLKSFRNGLKYNVMGLEMDWASKKTFTIINDPNKREDAAGVAAEEMYVGNRAKNIDMYNAIFDTRVPPNEVHSRGEFGGYVQLMPRTELKQLVIDLGAGNTMNVTDAMRSNCNSYIVGNNTPGEYYIPLINPMALISPQSQGQNWLAWASNITNKGGMEYKDLYEVAKLYIRVLPSDFGLKLPAQNTPQIFQLYVVNKQWIIYCKRMSNAHNFLPTVFGQPFDDDLGLQSKSFADNVTPYQEMASSLYASAVESKRRLVYDRLFYDPSRISKTDIDKVDSVARIPVKAAAYGKPISEAIWSSNYRDDSIVGTLQMAQSVQGMAAEANGQNRAQQGQFQKGNKTRFEFETVMTGANAKPRMYAISIEDKFMTPIKEIVKMNTVQYQPRKTLYSIPSQQEVQVDPQALRAAAFEFTLSDGQTPSDKLLSFELMGQVAQVGMAVPAINADYDILGILTYQWKNMGATWLNDFKRTPEQKAEFLATMAQTSTANAAPKDREPPSATAAAQAQQQPAA
jgi:hypothetical protein